MVLINESSVDNQVTLYASQVGVPLWRNNVGAFENEKGRWVRYGLCNNSSKDNRTVKSSDRIGIRPVLVTPEMVGSILGVFTAIEMKRSDWTYSDKDKSALAQKKFIDIVNSYGGFAGFARNKSDFERIVRI